MSSDRTRNSRFNFSPLAEFLLVSLLVLVVVGTVLFVLGWPG